MRTGVEPARNPLHMRQEQRRRLTVGGRWQVVVLREGQKAPLGCGVVVVDDVTTVALLLTGLLDPAKEIDKLKAKQAKTAERRDALAKKVGAAGYKEKTPAEVQASDAEKLATASKELEEVDSHIEDMQRMLTGQQ
eukprot:jgi/Botrbrau1/20724/Bobra.0058s0053.1